MGFSECGEDYPTLELTLGKAELETSMKKSLPSA